MNTAQACEAEPLRNHKHLLLAYFVRERSEYKKTNDRSDIDCWLNEISISLSAAHEISVVGYGEIILYVLVKVLILQRSRMGQA
jgi:hypothetical protein